MNQADLAQLLEMMAAALRSMPAVPGHAASSMVQPPAVPQRILSAWLDVHARQMTAVYEDDRGLSAKQYKRLAVTA